MPNQWEDSTMSKGRTFEFTDRALRTLSIPPKPQQLDYFDSKARGLGLRVPRQRLLDRLS